MRSVRLWQLVAVAALAAGPAPVFAQASPPPASPLPTSLQAQAQTAAAQPPAAGAPVPTTRQGLIEQAQAQKEAQLHPIQLAKGERALNTVQDILVNGLTWRPFFESAYQGGGFPFGVGYLRRVSSYNTLDVRGSWTARGYTRAEAEFVAPRLFRRRGQLSVLGGWRRATEVGFYGIGDATSKDDRANYEFERPYVGAELTLLPIRKLWVVKGGVEWTEWKQKPGHGDRFPTVEDVFTPDTLPGLNADVTYIHSQATAAFDWRPAAGYARRGGYYGVTGHDYHDRDGDFGFRVLEYEAVQHFPILRETWAISLRANVQTSFHKDDQVTPFFMLPSLGGSTSLRGFHPWRFRDNHALLLQGEWRVMNNRYFDTAFFYDAGKVGQRVRDLDFNGIRQDGGIGFRFHSLDATVLRVDLAKSDEGFRVVFAASHIF